MSTTGTRKTFKVVFQDATNSVSVMMLNIVTNSTLLRQTSQLACRWMSAVNAWKPNSYDQANGLIMNNIMNLNLSQLLSL